MPESITMDISGLDLGKSLKIGDIDAENFELLNSARVTIATVDIPRALKSGEFDEEEEAEEEGGEEGEAAAEETEGATEE
jgi:large subunit ribosomal protein L25